MSIKLYFVLFVLSFASVCEAETVYRLVDSNGKIIYTDKDPALVNTQKYSQEEITVKEAYSNITPITTVGSAYFCGSVQLPIRDVNSTNFYAQVVSNQKNWESEIDRLNRAIARSDGGSSSRSSSGNNSVENLRKLSEYHCAEDWAKDQKNNAKQEKMTLIKKSDGLHAYLQELQAGLLSICGNEPIYSTDDKLFSERRNAWNHCNADYSGKMQDIQSDLKRTDQQLLDIKRIEVENF